MRVAVDAMGGDYAPREVVRGALRCLEKISDLDVLLVGPPDALQKELGGRVRRLEIIPANEQIGMGEHPVEAIRKKPDSSLCRAVGLVKEARADAFVSAGNTGAAVAAATLAWGHLPGVRRAGIACPMPHSRGVSVVIDAGANVSPKPIHLVQYAVMASLFCRHVYGIDRPRVGLLNVGEEDEKGNELIREVAEQLRQSELNFIGNVEGHHIHAGRADVIVCDGFLGNVVLKACEGVFEMFLRTLGISLNDHMEELRCQGPLGQRLVDLIRIADFSSYGGAMLLGLNGVCLISHGRSLAPAFENAIRVAHQYAQGQINQKIVSAMEKLS